MRIPEVNISQIGLEAASPRKEEFQDVGVLLRAALSECGFVYLKGHGVPAGDVANVMDSSRAFFELNQAEKDKMSTDKDVGAGHGYVQPGQEMLDNLKEAPEAVATFEYRESFDVVTVEPTARFPDESVPQLRTHFEVIHDRLMRLTRRLLKTLSLAMDLDEDFFERQHSFGHGTNMSKFRSLYYPPIRGEVSPGLIRCGEHSDYGTVTLLFQDRLGGLQVRNIDDHTKWIDAEPRDGCVLVNVGDLLEVWSNGLFPATKHRVVVPEDELKRRTSRQSFVFFAHPDDDVVARHLLTMDPYDLNNNVTAECLDKCGNLTKLEWCDNLMRGYKVFHCTNPAECRLLCDAALACEERFQESPEGYCPMTFDGFSCVNATPPATQAVFQCPPYKNLNFHSDGFAYRNCSSAGEWWDTVKNMSYTHYDGCLDYESYMWFNLNNKIYITGYSISLVFLLLATFIFMFFRSLRCVRNTIHTNLFVASILHNAAWIIWYYAVIYRIAESTTWKEPGHIACRLLNVVVQYFMVCTYFWTLCEGVYLFVVLIVTFVSESRVVLSLHILGWGVPFVLVFVYAICRALLEDNDGNQNLCWMFESDYNWIYKAPCILTILLNLGFLLRIVHVLVSKLHSDVSDRAALVKTARAIGVLVPLFGLHNILGAFKPDDEDSTARIVIEIITAITISIQGMVVAILFCLINNEVCFQLKKFFGDRMDATRHQSIAMTQYTYVRPQGSTSPLPQANNDCETKTSTSFV